MADKIVWDDEGVKWDTPAPDSFLTKTRKAIQNVVEPAINVGLSLPVTAAANFAGAAGDIHSRMTETANIGPEVQKDVQEKLTFVPRNKAGQQNLEKFGKVFDESKLAGLPAADFNLARQSASAATQAAPAVQSVLNRSVNAAAQIPPVIMSATTSKSPKVFKEAYRAGIDRSTGKPETFGANMKGDVPVETMLSDAQAGIAKMQDDASAAYRDAKTGWAADKTTLDFRPIDEMFSRLEASTKEGGHSLLGEAERSKVDNVAAVIKEWRDDPAMHNTLGLDALKRRIDAIYPDSLAHNNAQRVITGARNAVKDTIVKQAPDYAEAMAGYESAQATLNDIRQALVGKDKASKDAAINKLLSLGKDKEFRRTQAENLKEGSGVDLMQAAAGQSLNDLLPSGLSGRLGGVGIGAWALHNPAVIAAAPLASPRLMGEASYLAGRARGALMPKAREQNTALQNFKEYEARLPDTPPLEVLPPGELPPSPMGGTTVGTGPMDTGVINLAPQLDTGLPSPGMGPQAALRAGSRDTTPQSPQMPAVEMPLAPKPGATPLYERGGVPEAPPQPVSIQQPYPGVEIPFVPEAPLPPWPRPPAPYSSGPEATLKALRERPRDTTPQSPQMTPVEMPLAPKPGATPLYERGGLPPEEGLQMQQQAELLRMPEVPYPGPPEMRPNVLTTELGADGGAGARAFGGEGPPNPPPRGGGIQGWKPDPAALDYPLQAELHNRYLGPIQEAMVRGDEAMMMQLETAFERDLAALNSQSSFDKLYNQPLGGASAALRRSNQFDPSISQSQIPPFQGAQ